MPCTNLFFKNFLRVGSSDARLHNIHAISLFKSKSQKRKWRVFSPIGENGQTTNYFLLRRWEQLAVEEKMRMNIKFLQCNFLLAAKCKLMFQKQASQNICSILTSVECAWWVRSQCCRSRSRGRGWRGWGRGGRGGRQGSQGGGRQGEAASWQVSEGDDEKCSTSVIIFQHLTSGNPHENRKSKWKKMFTLFSWLTYIRLGDCGKDCSKDESSCTDSQPANDQESFPGAYKCV